MPNAANVEQSKTYLVYALGYTGAGKTMNFLSFPGRKFAYIFDPNALRTLRGYDVDYELFMPDVQGFAVSSLKKDKGDKPKKGKIESFVYQKWEEHFENALATGFFDAYDSIMLDSGTTFLDIIMDRTLTINGRGGQWPNQDDYGPQMNAFTLVMRALTALNKNIYLTGHVEMIQDQLTHAIYQTPVLTGKLKAKIPILFSEIFFLEGQTDTKGKINYTCQTTPSRRMPLIRTTTRGLDHKEDITIDLDQVVEGQGLYGMLLKGSAHEHEQRGQRIHSPASVRSA